jgi:hypothetical protein
VRTQAKVLAPQPPRPPMTPITGHFPSTRQANRLKRVATTCSRHLWTTTGGVDDAVDSADTPR